VTKVNEPKNISEKKEDILLEKKENIEEIDSELNEGKEIIEIQKDEDEQKENVDNFQAEKENTPTPIYTYSSFDQNKKVKKKGIFSKIFSIRLNNFIIIFLRSLFK